MNFHCRVFKRPYGGTFNKIKPELSTYVSHSFNFPHTFTFNSVEFTPVHLKNYGTVEIYLYSNEFFIAKMYCYYKSSSTESVATSFRTITHDR